MKQGYTENGVNLIVLADMATETLCLIKITENGEQKIKIYQKSNIDKHNFFVKITI
jgi:hypothetical protein